MANPPKPWKAEYVKSSISLCRACKSFIDEKTLRLGKMVQAKKFHEFISLWNHAFCILQASCKVKQIKSIDDVEGLDLIVGEDQRKIRKYIDKFPE